MKSKNKRPYMQSLEIDEAVFEQLGLHYEAGWTGIITRQQDPHALYGNGTRVLKNISEREDATAPLTEGVVLGSIRAPGMPWCGYFVEWDDQKRYSVFVVEWKLAPVMPKP